jgi:CRP-like cAMP-binding protein
MSTESLTATEENTRNFLLNLPVFSSFDEEELCILAKHMSYVQLNKGEFLFVEGDPGTFMGFVLFGLLEVFKTTEKGESVVIARLTKGSPIGEMALIDKSPRSASVQAKQPTTLVTLTEKGFDLLMEKSPQLGVKVIQKIARLLSLNMRRTSSRLADLLRENK